MTISELIERLREFLATEGDLAVVAGPDYDTLGPLSGEIEREDWWRSESVLVLYVNP